MSFLSEFFNIGEGFKETAVCCPFDHFTSSGLSYKESNPSAHANTIEHLFHCKVCGVGYSETQFIQQVFGCSYLDAKRIQRTFQSKETRLEWLQETTLTDKAKKTAFEYGISESVLEELNVASAIHQEDALMFPVFMYGHLMDIRTYHKDSKPKCKSRAGCTTGLIIPFDIWKETSEARVTLVCAGEKDMAVARSQGFNAITITGGENCLPKCLQLFKNRTVAIVYDNDNAGIAGAKKLAMELLQYTSKVKVVTSFHEICKNEKEDITDFFIKYGKTKQDLIHYIEKTEYYQPTAEDKIKSYPNVNLLTASRPEKLNKMLQSNIQVVSVAESSFASPAAIIAEKFKVTGDKDTMLAGEFREWELNENTIQDVLHLIDNNFKEETIDKNIKRLLKIPAAERCVKVKTLTKQTVFKAYVTDLFETNDDSSQPMEFVAYSIGCKLESGQKYLVTYKLVPHPYKGQQLTMIITSAVQAKDSVSNFFIDDSVKENLNVIKNIPGDLCTKVHTLVQHVKGLLGYNGNDTLIRALDFAYHTVLEFNFGTFKNVRGYLDTIVVGESRVGKSSTADALRKTYGLGTFTSLAGNSATVPGLIGGSNKTANGYQTRAGIIPQNHKGLIIFEEFGKSNANIISELTDIRSSNEVRITRVSGTITLPAMVRMISLTNVKNTSGGIKAIAAYPNGIAIITELVTTAEDIARYDQIVILSDRGASQIDPLWKPLEPLATEVYQTRVRWVWSRKPEDVILDDTVSAYIVEQANALNKTYDCHIKIFGTEAWKKITRLAIAVAAYVVSTDESYEKIIVNKEHVDYAVAFYKLLYDNPTFKLREYVEHEKRYSTIDEEGVALLQDLYVKSPSLIQQLEQCASATKNMLSAATGLTNDELNKALNRLTRGLFIQFSNHDIIPTERFRLGLAKINKNISVKRLGEE
jgi:hypothetical protein